MNQTGLRAIIGGLLGWSTLTERKRRRRLKRSMQENKQVPARKCTIEIKID